MSINTRLYGDPIYLYMLTYIQMISSSLVFFVNVFEEKNCIKNNMKKIDLSVCTYMYIDAKIMSSSSLFQYF